MWTGIAGGPDVDVDVELQERIGGTRSAVHRAVVRRSGRVVVVKRATWDQPEAVAGLEREAEVLGLVHHRSLVRLLGQSRDGEGLSLVLEHAAGGPLGPRAAVAGGLDVATVIDVARSIASCLSSLHAAGVLHRDVTPDHVLLDAELVPILCDLDHALADGAAPVTADARVVGTPEHLDPRLLAGIDADAAADLYGLGSTLWTLLTGCPPHGVGSDAPARAAARERDRLGDLVEVPQDLAHLVEALLRGEVQGASEAAGRAAALGGRSASVTTPPPVRVPGGQAVRPGLRRSGEGLRPGTNDRHGRGRRDGDGGGDDDGDGGAGGTRSFGPRPPGTPAVDPRGVAILPVVGAAVALGFPLALLLWW